MAKPMKPNETKTKGWHDYNANELDALACAEPEEFARLAAEQAAATNPELMHELRRQVAQWKREGKIDDKAAAAAEACIVAGDVIGVAKILGANQAPPPDADVRSAVKMARADLKYADLTPVELAQLLAKDPKRYEALRDAHEFRPATATRLR